MINGKNKLIVFNNKEIRRVWHNKEWWYSLLDIILILTESKDPKQYIKKLRMRDESLNSNWGTICTLLEMTALDGKKRKITSCNLKGTFRVIQSIPSKKAEPFKQWLAQVGQERVEEIENPELTQKRMKELYEQKGYSKDWIDKRVRGIIVRQELTDEWKQRGINNNKEYSILTSQISKATFNMTPNQYKELKNLDKENLRDHMTDLELIFSMLGEKVTTEITKKENKQGFKECKNAAIRGGTVAKKARLDTQKELNSSIITSENYLEENEETKKRIK